MEESRKKINHKGRGTKRMVIIIVAIVIFLIGIYCAFNIHERHYVEDGKLYKALHIKFLGYSTVYYPEQTVDLQQWVGSKYDGLIATANGTENAEATAGLALQVACLYTDYSLKEQGGHYVLYRPAKEERYFTWDAFYQIWFGEEVKE